MAHWANVERAERGPGVDPATFRTTEHAVPALSDLAGPTPKHKWTIAVIVGLCAFAWLLTLSSWLGVKPGAVITMRYNVLFNSDMNLWVDRIIGNIRAPQQIVHPLELLFWRSPCRALDHILLHFVSPESARLVATRLFTSFVSAAGVTALALLALTLGVTGARFALLFVIYLLFTTNATICLPEHFAISNGLLCLAFVTPCLIASTRLRAAILAALGVLCGGTTVTNVAFPAASIVQFSLKSWRSKAIAVLVGVPFGLGLFFLGFLKSDTIHWFVSHYLNLRGLTQPIRVFSYLFYAFVAPAVGPVPLVLRVPGWDMVSYEPGFEPVHISYYLGVPLIGATAWIILLFVGMYHGFRDARTRPFMWLPLGWVIFSGFFHNVWGQEIILYAPHWSWALMGMVILGARRLPMTAMATITFAIVLSQVYTLIAIRNALQTIVQ